jgi:hypothetical protein
VMLIIVTSFVVAFLWFAPKAFRLLRIETNAIVAVLKKLFLKLRGIFVRNRAGGTSGEPHTSMLQSSNASKLPEITNDEMPIEYVYHLRDAFDMRDRAAVIKCAAGKGVRGLRHSIGYLNITSTEAIFMSKRWLRLRYYTVPRQKIEHVHFKKHLLMDRLTLRTGGKQHVFYFFKDASNRGEMISRALRGKEGDLGHDLPNPTRGGPIKLVPVSQPKNG